MTACATTPGSRRARPARYARPHPGLSRGSPGRAVGVRGVQPESGRASGVRAAPRAVGNVDYGRRDRRPGHGPISGPGLEPGRIGLPSRMTTRLSEEPRMTQQGNADIGVTGLAVMGRNLARNLARHGNVVALHNRSPERTRSLVSEHGDEGTFVPAESMKEFVASLSQPRAIIIMVKAGEPTDAVIDELVPLLDEGDIVIDCGNAHFMDTRRREAALREHGLHFVGCGVSGGEEGALLGPSIMPGGSRSPTRSSARSSSPSPPRWTARRAARTWARTAPATSSRWCTTASSTRTCSSSPRPTTCCGRAWGRRRPRSPGSSAPGTRGTWIRSSSRSPRRCWRTPTPRPGSRSWTSCSIRPSRRAPAGGRCRARSTWVSRSPASPRPPSPGPCPATRTSVRPPGRRSGPR